MLVDRQGLSPGMTRDELEFSIGHAAVPSQPSDALVPEDVGRGVHPRLLGIDLHDLLNPPRRVPGVATGLE